MKKKYTYLTASVLTAVTMLPTFAPSEAHAAYNWNGNNSYYTRTSRRSSNRTSNRTTANRSRTSNYTVRSYGYNSYYPSYNYGYNSYYPSYNYGYGSYYPSYNYGYNNWNNYYGYDNSSNYYGYNYWNSYNNLASDENYIYWNGNHYYRMNDGSYRIYRNGQWKPLTNNSNNNSSTNNLENDPHYRYENGYHYYVLDNGDYYYYQNGKWVLVKDSADTTPAQPAQPAEPTPAQPATPAEPKPEQPATPSVDLPENPPINGADSEFDPFKPSTETPAEPKPETPATPAIPTTPGLVTTDEPSENQIPDYVEKPAEGLEHLAWAPNGQTPKLVYPPGKPGDAVLKNDKNYYFDGSAHYYYVSSNSERTGYSAYWKWLGGKWKLQGMTDPNDPARDPKLHENTADDEYMYSDKNSSVKLYSTNLVTTAKAGQALPFKNVEEFKNYVIEKMNPKFLDNSGWDAKVEWEIEDPEIFEKTKENPYAKDYVLIANLKSGVEDKKYSDVEFGYVKFVYRVEATNDTNYDYVSKAKEAFAKINETRKAQGLKELTWSEDIYQNQALPKVNEISRQYDSTGFVGRRDEDAAVVVKKWANSGLRDLLLDPNVTEGAVAAVVDGNGVYYWAYSYK
ncbi:CAP domain-containing protein [Streptococcus oralis]|uniref:CAP domain-containing protein n=1 Tax=Streptococcus oralis TaxID=1303 RepID=UPI001BE9FD09|nr:CAP domain-containing protein [Streptococcus oralis]MBT3115502.1 CAP domain-containing protein [Streptococcus oralis]